MLKVATVLPHEPYREYKDVERVYSGSTEIDKILDKNGNVLFAVNKEVEGTPALTYKGKEETNLKNYRIYGNTETKTRSYSGSAPLSFPIMDGAVSNYRIYGQTTSRNLFDETIYNKNVADNTVIYVPMYVGNVDYVTCSTTCPKTGDSVHDGNNSRYIFFISGSVDAGAQNDVNGVSNGVPRTIPATNGYVTIAYRKIESHNVRPWEYQTMLNVGSTALPYEPYGESVGDRTRNILPMSTTPIDTIIDDFHCEYDGMGTIILTATKDNADFSSFTIPLKEDFIIPISVDQGGNGCVQFNNDKAYTTDSIEHANFMVCFNSNNTQIDFWRLSEVNRINYAYSVMGGHTINNISINKTEHFIPHLAKGDKLTIRPAFYNNGTTNQVPFEPYGYKIPVTNNSETANIYLDEPLRKVGDEADYVDYAEQKRYNADGTNEDVTLPALPAQSSTNSLSIGTTVQPSSLAVDVAEVVSCGDKVTDSQSVNYGKYKIPVQVEGKNLVTSYLVELNGGIQFHPVVFAEVNLQPNTEYLITFTVHENGVKLYSNDLLFTSIYYSNEIQGKKTMRLKTKTSTRPDQHINNKGWVLLRNAKQNPSDFTITDVKLQLVSDAPIYLDEPLAKSGNNADYIDYATQKRHNSDGTESSVTLPEVSTLAGTNTLSVGTEVQPSNVYLKGRIKEIT